MGVIIQELPNNSWDTTECTFVPAHLCGLFNEFLMRYKELQKLRQIEMKWLILVMFLGLTILIRIMIFPNASNLLNLGFGIIFITTLRHYLHVKKSSTHAFVNVHILHHHFLGKLEVGFCRHESSCQCVENFRRYVWEKYRISFYGNRLIG